MLRLIAGVLSRDGGPPDEGALAAMLDTMNPNGLAERRDVAVTGPLALGVVSLAPVGADAPAPAAVRRRGGLVLVADARVYTTGTGFDALHDGPGDDATFADAVAADPEGFLDGMQADLAAAIWNGQRLTLIRDHFGVRTLNWCDRPGRDFAFASLPGPPIEAGFAPRVIDTEALLHFHDSPCPPPGRTWYRHVHALEPAHRLEVTPSRAPRVRRWWRVPLRRFVPFDSDPADLAHGLAQAMDRGVRRRLARSGPVAGHLSGGLDSSTLAVLAARAVRDTGRLYHGYTQQEPRGAGQPAFVDEAPWVEAVAAAEPNIALVRIPDRGVYPMIEAGLDIDTMNPVTPDDIYLAPIRHAAAQGIGVVFSGWGGDEFASFGGRGAEAELLLHGRFRQLARHLRAYRARKGGSAPGVFANLVLSRLLPFGLAHPVRRRLAGLGQPVRWPFLPAGGRVARRQDMMLEYPDTRLNRRRFAEAWWLGHRLTVFAQQGALHGVATSYPLLDLDVVEHVCRIPGFFFRRDGGYRTLMRDATRGILPETVRTRHAKLMPYPLESLRMAHEALTLGPRLDALEAEPLVRRFVDVGRIRRFVATIGTPEEVARKTAEAAAAGEQYAPDDSAHIKAYVLAHWLARHAQSLDVER